MRSAASQFLPGQWLDVFVPGVSKAGGFTITSAPSKARWATATSASASAGAEAAAASEDGGKVDNDDDDDSSDSENSYAYLELAVQRSPDNPPAAWLWQEEGYGDGGGVEQLLGTELGVRVGGSFVWPPPGVNVRALRKVVFVAGGVGVNPLVSMRTYTFFFPFRLYSISPLSLPSPP